MAQKIMIIDDNVNHRDLIKTNIQLEIPDVEIKEMDDAASVIRSLSQNKFNLIMLDYILSG